MRATSGVLLLALVAAAAAAVTFDKGLTTSMKAGVQEDKLFLSFRRVGPPRKLAMSPPGQQVVMSLAFPGHSRFSVVLDRARSNVVVESLINGERQTQRVAAPWVKPRKRVMSLLVEIDQQANNANIYVNCRLMGSLNLPKAPRDMTSDLQELRVYRERHQEVSVDWDTSVLELLEKLGCQGDGTGEVQAQANEVYTYRRGDIPIIHEDETSIKLVKTLTELIETIKELQIEIQTQREETALLRDALLNCEACKPDNDPCSPNPCYPGVECMGGPDGARCGPCPRNFIGDGHNCEPAITCADRPCARAQIIIAVERNYNYSDTYRDPVLFPPNIPCQCLKPPPHPLTSYGNSYSRQNY